MTIHKALITSSLACLFGTSSVSLAGPPVKVEVVIDEDEEADFFSETATPPPRSRKQQVEENADALFDDLEREEIAHGKRRAVASAKDGNKSNQVVNVIVQTPETPSVPGTPEPDVDRPMTRQERRAYKLQLRRERREAARQERLARIQEKIEYKRQKLELKRQKLELKREHRRHQLQHRGWWNRPSWAERGDLLLHGKAGLNGMGPFGGLGVEYMASDWLGLRLGGQFARVDGDDADDRVGPNFDFSRGGRWANPSDVDASLQEGHVHLIESSLALHVIPRSRFDIYPNVGIGYMGYKMDYEDRTEKGGAGYLRLGAGFNIVVKRFYAGLDFGWYPYEIFQRGGTPPVAQSEAGLSPAGRAEPVVSGEASNVEQDEGDGGRFDPLRMTLTAHVGIRF